MYTSYNNYNSYGMRGNGNRGGFFVPFILGGIAGSLWNNNRPNYYYPVPTPYYYPYNNNYYYSYPVYYN